MSLLLFGGKTPPPPGFFLFFPIFFVGMWMAVCAITSYANGWHKLSKRFRSLDPFQGSMWNFQSARVGIANYGNCLSVGANFQGMYMRPFVLFRFAHPPLLIPWNEISVQKKRFWIFGEYFILRLGRQEQVNVAIANKLAERLQAEAGNQWPLPERGT